MAILTDPVRSCGPQIKRILRLLFSILKKINFQVFLGIDVCWEEGRGSQTNVQREKIDL